MRVMNATTILNKILPFLSPNIHKNRRNALAICIQIIAQGNLSTMINIGSKSFEKHRIKRADRNFHLQKNHFLRISKSPSNNSEKGFENSPNICSK